MMPVYNGGDRIVFDYCCLAIIDLINSSSLLYLEELMACLCVWWVHLCFRAGFELLFNQSCEHFFFLTILSS